MEVCDLPDTTGTERVLLGSILTEPECWISAAEISVEDFRSNDYRHRGKDGYVTLHKMRDEIMVNDCAVLYWLLQMHRRSNGLNAGRTLLALELEPWLKEETVAGKTDNEIRDLVARLEAEPKECLR